MVVNVTLAIDEKLVVRAREVARRRQTTLNQLVRDFLEELTTPAGLPTVAQEFERLWAEHEGHSGGRTWQREDLYDRPVLR